MAEEIPEAAHPEFTELAQFEIDSRSVRMLEREYCLENDVVVLGVQIPRRSCLGDPGPSGGSRRSRHNPGTAPVGA